MPPQVRLRSPLAIRQAIDRLAEPSLTRRLRTLREFAEDEIVLPSGPYQGQHLKIDRNPWLGLWLDAVDSGRWRRFNLTGVSQGGKTLGGSAIPVMYHLFECRETVIYAAPTLEMAADKWKQDVLPAIDASRFKDLLPDSGRGSRGGTATSIQFKHGPTLRFMTGGGGDKVRAGFTSRAVVITETDGMDESGGTSRETDKIGQLEARANAYGDRARLYMECTVSTETGRTWKELKEGTDSRIALPCPHCHAWVTPEREHLSGWQDAATVIEARENAVLCCPDCGTFWTEADRTAANQAGRLLHRGQALANDGTVQGMLPKTLTLGFRFSCVNNLLVSMARVAEQEWSAPRRSETEAAERELRQFYWTLPSEPEAVTISEMDAAAITVRTADLTRGRVPADATMLTVGMDIGKWLCHFVVVGWREHGTPHVVEYGRLEVPSQTLSVEVAILTALRRFRDEVCKPGWAGMAEGTANKSPALVFVDARDWGSTVKAFCVESGPCFVATQGHAITRVNAAWATDPGYDARAHARDGILPLSADLWKSFVHARLQTPAGQPGGLTLFKATPQEHLSFAKHLTAEKRVEEFVPGKGTVFRWEAISRNNHFLDALSMACAAGHAAGQRIITPAISPAPERQPDRQPDRPSWMPDRPTSWTNR